MAVRIERLGTREHFLSLYGPLSLIALLLIWLLLLAVGWGLVWWAVGEGGLRGASGLGDDLYFSGSTLVTLGFGDLVPVGGPARALAVLEAVTGLGTIALLISYLPALHAAYARREVRLLTLDDPSGERLSPIGIAALHAPDADLERLYRFYGAWELWTADLLESHGAYPVLGYFRSQNPGQSWVTALGVVLDSATLVCANVPGADRREPYFMHRRGRRTIQEMSRRFQLAPSMAPLVDRDRFVWTRKRLTEMGLPLLPEGEAWERLTSLRASYGQALEDLIDHLLAPRGFWGLSSPVSEIETAAEGAAQALLQGSDGLRGMGESAPR